MRIKILLMVERAILLKFERNCFLWSIKWKSSPRTFVGIVCARWRNEGRAWRIFREQFSSENCPIEKMFQCSVTSPNAFLKPAQRLSRTSYKTCWRRKKERKKEPSKEKNRPVAFAAVVGPVSPIPAREPEEKKASVQVTVESPSRTKVNTLHEGLET